MAYEIKESEALTHALNKYDGVVPILLLPHVNFIVYEEHLKSLDNHDEIMKEFGDVRLGLLGAEDKDKFREDQLRNWLKENKEFEEFIIID